MVNVDVGLFDFDFDTTFQIFLMNGDEQIYLRYGGRDDRSPTSYLSQKGLLQALETGLALHKQWKAGTLTLPPRPPRRLSNTYSVVQTVLKRKGGNCVHCHHVASSKAEELIKQKGFDRLRDGWIFPNPLRLGLELDRDRGLRVKKTGGAAKKAGIRSSDTVRKVGDHAVYTFTDLQLALDKVPVDQENLTLTVARKKGGKETEETATITLAENWRVTDLNWRSYAAKLEPYPGFWAKPLTEKEKRKLGLPKDGFASRVTKFWTPTNGKRAGLYVGDVVYEVNGVRTSPLAQNVMLYIRLHHKVGETITVKATRGRKKVAFSYKLRPRAW
jgi:hypothetical protein